MFDCHLALSQHVSKGFLSTSVLITDLISIRGDIHHIFPKDFLKRHGLSQNKYNQIANYVYMQSEINIKVGNRSPKDYMELLRSQIQSGNRLISGHSNEVELIENLKMNAIPVNFDNYGIEEYDDFLLERRKLMALKIRDYYYSL